MQTIHDLAKQVSQALGAGHHLHELQGLLTDYLAEDWKNYCDFIPNGYQRVPIFDDQRYEMRLLCWDGNISSALHDHPDNGCMLKVLAGDLVEARYTLNPTTLEKETKLSMGMVSYIHGKEGIHRIINPHSERAVSLHIYAPAGYMPNFYSDEDLA